ncbi:MAG: ribosome biogenesis GTP-binding protein YihA/YsxC [Polyangiales bacterium]|nr:YihA family ribosome biogenesis GTP-binding protein [Myxococcales bacterium]
MKIRDAVFVASAAEHEQLPPPAFAEVAFAGRSNVGKSSLINCLVERRKLVRTSNTPGATRAINIFHVTLAEPDAVLDVVDLPGYGFARRSKKERKHWGVLIDRFLRERAGLHTVVLLADARRGFEDDDLDLLAYLEELGKTPILVATKFDELKTSEKKLRLKALSTAAGRRVLPMSAKTGEGRDALWAAVLKASRIATGD